MSYTPLHTHSQYSLLDGAILIPQLIQHLKNNNINACAITDHGWLAGVVDFYQQCKKADIKPILGMEAYITEDQDNLLNEEKTRDNMHMILLAKDNEGYSLLCQLASTAALENMYYKPRIYREHLKKLSGHVICTTACLGGILAKKLEFETDQYGRAICCTDPIGIVEKDLQFYKDIFQDDFYLELQVWNDGEHYQDVYNKTLLEFGEKYQLPFVITSDAHYLTKDDYELHELLMAMQFKTTLDNYRENSEMHHGPYFYLPGPEEMLERAKSINCEQAYHNTNKIAEQCNVELILGKYEEPVFDITQVPDFEDFMKWKEK